MKRRLLNLLTALSLLLCVATCALWVRASRRDRFIDMLVGGESHASFTFWHRAIGGRDYSLRGHEGAFGVHALPNDFGVAYSARPHSVSAFVLLGNGFTYRTWWNGRRSLYVFVSYWIVIASTAILPLRYAARSTKRRWAATVGRRRSKVGLCPQCGYDLRATPGRCPECGTEVARAA